jgi:DHA2 family multidrug resistance protein
MARTPRATAETTDSLGLAQPAAPAAAASRQTKWGISLAVILGSLITSIMFGSLNISLPTMMTSLRAEVNQIQWVLTTFMITRTVMMPTLGWVGGILGNRFHHETSGSQDSSTW